MNIEDIRHGMSADEKKSAWDFLAAMDPNGPRARHAPTPVYLPGGQEVPRANLGLLVDHLVAAGRSRTLTAGETVTLAAALREINKENR